MIRLSNILKEGTLQLTPDERRQVEEMLPDIVDIVSGEYLGDGLRNAVEVGRINYTFADKTPGSVQIVVGNDMTEKNANGYFSTNDPKNPKDNRIWIQQFQFKPFFNILGKAYSSLTGDKNQGIELLRKTLKHELIHAKDPAVNQHFLKEPYDSSKAQVYFKSWAEFQTMTGQFFEAITTGVDRALKQDSSKEGIKKIEKALKNILDFYSGKMTITGMEKLTQDTVDFIQGTGKRNVFQSLIKFAENTLGTITGVRIVNALDAYVDYIKGIKKYNPEGYREFLTDLYKTVDAARDRLKSLKEMKYNNQVKRLQELAGITNEDEVQVDPVADKDAEKGLKQALNILQSGAESAKPSDKAKELDESLLLTAVVSAPEIVKLAGKAVNGIVSLFQKDKKKGTVVGNALKKWGKELEHQYILGLANLITKVFPGLYDNQDPLDQSTALYDAAHGLYAGIIAATALGTGMSLAGAHSVASGAVEGGALFLKKSEVEKLIQKIQAKPAIS